MQSVCASDSLGNVYFGICCAKWRKKKQNNAHDTFRLSEEFSLIVIYFLGIVCLLSGFTCTRLHSSRAHARFGIIRIPSGKYFEFLDEELICRYTLSTCRLVFPFKLIYRKKMYIRSVRLQACFESEWLLIFWTINCIIISYLIITFYREKISGGAI